MLETIKEPHRLTPVLDLSDGLFTDFDEDTGPIEPAYPELQALKANLNELELSRAGAIGTMKQLQQMQLDFAKSKPSVDEVLTGNQSKPRYSPAQVKAAMEDVDNQLSELRFLVDKAKQDILQYQVIILQTKLEVAQQAYAEAIKAVPQLLKEVRIVNQALCLIQPVFATREAYNQNALLGLPTVPQLPKDPSLSSQGKFYCEPILFNNDTSYIRDAHVLVNQIKEL